MCVFNKIQEEHANRKPPKPEECLKLNLYLPLRHGHGLYIETALDL